MEEEEEDDDDGKLELDDDISDNHADDLFRYINEMTYETNKMVGLNNLRLVWKVNFFYHDPDNHHFGQQSS